LRLLADTDCEDLEAASATNLVGPFRLSKALLGALAAAAREGRPARIVHITSDAAVTPYPRWGAYGASKAALQQLSRIWHEELREHGVQVIDIDPGDMDTPLHALAVPDADPATLKRPADAAREILARLAATALPSREVSA
jgi:NAD(P)-dependent dehydrogenase (short-subunit alcohol dehydrogenase family)